MKECKGCKKIKDISEFYKDYNTKDGLNKYCIICINFKRKKYYEEHPWLSSLRHAKQRCNNPNNKDFKYYGERGIEFHLTDAEGEILWFRDKAYLMKKPSINRKNNNGNYTLDNCEFIELGKNVGERNTRVDSIPIIQYDLQMNKITHWPNAREIERKLNFSNANIIACCLGKYKQAYGYIWRQIR